MLWLLAVLTASAPCPTVTLGHGADVESLAGRFCWSQVPAPDPIAARAGPFQVAAPGQAKLPRSSGPLWIRHEIDNRDHPDADWVLQLWTVPTDAAEVYVLDGERVVSSVQTPHPPSRSYHPVDVHVPRGERRVVLTRLWSSRVPVAPVALSTRSALASADFDKQLVMGLFFGLGLALVLYNAFLFLAMRQASYLAYVLHGSTVWLLILGENGMVDIYFDGWIPRWSPLGTPMLAIAAGSAVLFARVFLFGAQRTAMRRVLDALVVACGLAAAVTLVPAWADAAGGAVDALLLACIAAMILAAVVRVRDGHSPARYYLVAWLALFLPMLAWLAEAYGLIPQSLATRYASEIGVALEMLLMSLALAASLTSARRAAHEAERAHSSALEAVLAQQASVNEALTLAHQRAVEASELKTAFLTKVSHELRTPLNHVIGMSAALHDTALDEEQREMNGYVAQAGQSLAAMVERLLDLSAVERGDWVVESRELDLLALIDEVVASRRGRAADRGIALVVAARPVLGRRFGDRAGIRRALIELVDNAIRFTRAGSVSIGVRAVPEDVVLIDVVDTGEGIPAHARDKLFGLFSQVDDSMTRAHEGLGVGLAVAQRVMETLGGSIAMSSEEGRGSTFTLRLPLRVAPPPPRASAISRARVSIAPD